MNTSVNTTWTSESTLLNANRLSLSLARVRTSWQGLRNRSSWHWLQWLGSACFSETRSRIASVGNAGTRRIFPLVNSRSRLQEQSRIHFNGEQFRQWSRQVSAGFGWNIS